MAKYPDIITLDCGCETGFSECPEKQRLHADSEVAYYARDWTRYLEAREREWLHYGAYANPRALEFIREQIALL